MTLAPGIYQHFKGRQYKVIGVARHSETEEQLVVYQPLYGGKPSLWVRPLHLFIEQVETDQGCVNRFELLEADQGD